jgi:predicted secreted protein
LRNCFSVLETGWSYLALSRKTVDHKTPESPETQPAGPWEDLAAEGRAEEPIVLPIAAGPATGYVWHLELPEGIIRIDDGPERFVEASVRLGGASGGRLRVTAPAGEHVVVARLARPWQPDNPIRVVRIHLHIV